MMEEENANAVDAMQLMPMAMRSNRLRFVIVMAVSLPWYFLNNEGLDWLTRRLMLLSVG